MLHKFEYNLLRRIQKAPGHEVTILPIALGVHYSLLVEIITPLLSLGVWTLSHQLFASLIAFACVNDLLNSAVKWAVQRPRPSWYSTGGGLATPRAWERDLSFPSAHTQFFAGIAFCGCQLCHLPLSAAAAFGVVTGVTRNYLGVHWCTDTLAGLALGAASGLLWGAYDPYARLARAGSPLLAFSSATAAGLGLLALLVTIRRLVPARSSAVRRFWLGNALAAFKPTVESADEAPTDELDGTTGDGRTRLSTPLGAGLVKVPRGAGRPISVEIDALFQPRSLTSKLPQLTSTWCILAFAGMHASLGLGPDALACGSATRRAVQGVVGLSGLMLWRQVMKTVKRAIGLSAGAGADEKKKRAALKTITYVGVCAWTFAGAQKVSLALLAACA